jgi:alkaline phosphatase D
LEQPLWVPIIENNTELWIWLGDNIYADTEDMLQMKAKYDSQLAIDNYQKLIKKTQVIGVWDDHDFGLNDGGKNYPMKEESKALMLDFFGVAKNAEVRSRPGAYQSFEFGEKPRKLKIILLDTRYFRDDLVKQNGEYVQLDTGTLLGEVQWDWLMNELENSKADVHLIGSSIQVIPEEHTNEKWANFIHERERLLSLLSGVKNPIILSGDRHIGEFSKKEVNEQLIYEVTSSGMTHPWKSFTGEPNKHRHGKVVTDLHFGLITFNWEDHSLIVQLKGVENDVLQEMKIPLNE